MRALIDTVVCGILTAVPLKNPVFLSNSKMEVVGFFEMLISFPVTRITM
jgi:hypothetical protein